MKILQVHNKYTKRGGEETVLEEEKRLLESHGHSVFQFLKENKQINGYSPFKKSKVLLSQRSSSSVVRELEEILVFQKPDICHVHNIYPLITPAVFLVCQKFNVPVVYTLHNYKMVCTNSLLFRKGQICELCLDKSLYNSIRYRCYRNSYILTALQADTIQYHRNRNTWVNLVDQYICLTDFQKSKLVQGGMSEDGITVKPNFIHEINLSSEWGDFFLFVGRLDESKGLKDLLWLVDANENSQFVLIGSSDDPINFEAFKNVHFIGPQNREVVLDYMRRCRAVLFPSHYYEGMPMVILEAFALGKPVVARDIGAMSSMIQDQFNGLKYINQEGFAEAIELLGKNEDIMKRLGANALKDYKNKYSEDIGYKNLMKVYQHTINQRNAI